MPDPILAMRSVAGTHGGLKPPPSGRTIVDVRGHSALRAIPVVLTIGLLAGVARAGSVERTGPGTGPLGGSRAVIVSHSALLHTAQVFATDGAGQIVAGLDELGQARLAWGNLGQLLGAMGSDERKIVRLNVVVTDVAAGVAMRRVLLEALSPSERPSVTLVEGALPLDGSRVALDVVALGAEASAGQPAPDSTTLAWLPGLRAASRIEAGPRVYISGRAADGTPADAAADVLRQIDRTLQFLLLDRQSVIQLKCFLRPVSAAGEVHERIAEHFLGEPPPVVFVEWKNRQPIEIEAIAQAASLPDRPTVQYITPPWDRASPIFARVVRIDHPASIYLSTVNGRTPNRGDLQVREMFDDLSVLLSEVGSDFRHLAKATYYVADERSSVALNEVRPEHYEADRPPAASKASVRGTGVPGMQLAVDMIAVPSK